MERGRFPGGGNGMESASVRLWPHRLAGEGHFLAVVERGGSPADRSPEGPSTERFLPGRLPQQVRLSWETFCEELFWDSQTMPWGGGRLFFWKDRLWLIPEGMPDIDGLRVLRTGLCLGDFQRKHFQPDHALAMALSPQAVKRCINFDANGKWIRAYFGGQALPAQALLEESLLSPDLPQGWYLVAVDGYSAGWAKLTGSVLKNHYPKGLRKVLPF